MKDDDINRFNKTCIPRMCGNMTAPDEGAMLATEKVFRYPMVVEFQCRFGYQMMGPSHLQCTADGTWNGTAPHCIRTLSFDRVSYRGVEMIESMFQPPLARDYKITQRSVCSSHRTTTRSLTAKTCPFYALSRTVLHEAMDSRRSDSAYTIHSPMDASTGCPAAIPTARSSTAASLHFSLAPFTTDST